MANNNEIKITLSADDKASASLNKVKSSLSDFATKNTETFSKMAVAGTAAFGAITAVAGTSLNAFAESERANRQLEHAVLDVSKGTKEQVTQIKNLTQALQDKAGIDADSLNMGVAQLSTFGLSTTAVKNLTKSLADLTVNQDGVNASGDQYISSANIMAKAMRGEFGMLEKMGIRFTEHQQELITTGTETEKVSALQEGLAKNLRETTDTLSGVDVSTAKAKRSFEDMQEALGGSLATAFGKLSEAITPVIKSMTKWMEENPKLTETIVLCGLAVTGLVAGLGALGLAITAITPVVTTFGMVMSTAWGPIGVLITLIGILAITIYKNWDEIKIATQIFTEYLQGLFTKFKERVKEIWDGIIATINTAWDSIKSSTEAAKTTLENKFYSLWDKIKNIFQQIKDSIVDTWSAGMQAIKDMADGLISDVVNAFTALGEKIKNAISFDGLVSKAKAAADKIRQYLPEWAGGTSSDTSTTQMAIGGPVTAGVPYTVGEMGREIFIPSTSGRIVPNGAVGGASITINMGSVSIKDNNDLEYFMQEMESRLQRAVSNANLYAI